MALDACVKDILCSLSDAVLRDLQVLIDGQITLIQAQITVFQAQLLQYDIITLPIQASQQAAQAVVNAARQSATLIPLNVIAGCADLGDFNINLQESIDVALGTSNDLLFEANRLLSFTDELNNLVTSLNATIEQFTDIQSIIDECLLGT